VNVDENHATRPPDGSPGDTQLQSTQRAATVPLLVSFAAGNIGAWRIDRITPAAGDSLAGAPRLNVIESGSAMNGWTAAWSRTAGPGGLKPCPGIVF
jgi:hypothetical protein